ncbi:hypothetical protein C0966_00640 [Bacillus methanolicus]|uniref:HNH endonuclease n=1 Tax=Bacillus methanolicus TaxID=1471 RepID=UPI002380AB9F|nr:HNH endonuclease [Bacillus methanolicus]MDE3837915.1 hypothetical protein [Bacillus methanolicus]
MKNDYEICGDITKIFIKSPKHGEFITIISTSDLPRVKEFPNSWCLSFDRKVGSFYVYGMTPRPNRKAITLHRWIMGDPKGFVVDHINHDTLNNTRENLRVLSHAENMQNRKGIQKNNKTGVRGVGWDKKNQKWYAKVTINRKVIWLGYYENKEDAIKVVEEKRKEILPYSVNKEVN